MDSTHSMMCKGEKYTKKNLFDAGYDYIGQPEHMYGTLFKLCDADLGQKLVDLRNAIEPPENDEEVVCGFYARSSYAFSGPKRMSFVHQPDKEQSIIAISTYTRVKDALPLNHPPLGSFLQMVIHDKEPSASCYYKFAGEDGDEISILNRQKFEIPVTPVTESRKKIDVGQVGLIYPKMRGFGQDYTDFAETKELRPWPRDDDEDLYEHEFELSDGDKKLEWYNNTNKQKLFIGHIGVIDEQYDGQIKICALFDDKSKEDDEQLHIIKPGHVVAQLKVFDYYMINSDTDQLVRAADYIKKNTVRPKVLRGKNGFGSTGDPYPYYTPKDDDDDDDDDDTVNEPTQKKLKTQ